MRLRHPDGSLLHLAYCSNVHPADDLEGVAGQLERYAARGHPRGLEVPAGHADRVRRGGHRGGGGGEGEQRCGEGSHRRTR